MRTLIKVKQSHIEKARSILANPKQSKSRNCPIALALKEKFGTKAFVIVGKYCCGVNFGPLLDMPRSCKRFIAKFDSGKSVKPFNFFYNS